MCPSRAAYLAATSGTKIYRVYLVHRRQCPRGAVCPEIKIEPLIPCAPEAMSEWSDTSLTKIEPCIPCAPEEMSKWSGMSETKIEPCIPCAPEAMSEAICPELRSIRV